MILLIVAAHTGTTDIQALIDAQKWAEAEVQLESLSEASKPRFEGLIAQGQGAHLKAAAAFERALAVTPDVPQLHLHAAHAYLAVDRFEEALRHARAARALRDETVAQPLLEARA